MSTSNNITRLEPFRPTPTQKNFIQCTDKQVLMSGSFGAGKSRIGCEKGYIINCKYPGNRGLIVRNTFTDVRASTIEQTLLEEVIPESHIYRHNKTKHIIEHRTGHRGPDNEPVLSEIQYHGLDSTGDGLPTKIGGQQYGWIFVDEGIEISKGAWVQLLGRLRFNGRTKNGKKYKVPFRQIYTATNPASKTHWMYDWFFNEEKGTYFMMTARELSDHVDAIPDDYVETMAESYTGMYFDRYVEGKWVATEGMVYNEYDSKVHLKQSIDMLPKTREWTVEKRINHGTHTSVHVTPPESFRVYRSIDFGYRNPFVCYDDQTEILTEDGWVDFPELQRGVNVATVNQETREVEYQQPLSYIEQEYTGDMVAAQSKQAGVDFKVTPNHQMVVDKEDGSWEKYRADELPEWYHGLPVGGWTVSDNSEADETFTIPSANEQTKPLNPVKKGDFAEFLGFWIAEGSAGDGVVSVSQGKDDSPYVRSLLEKLGWPAYEGDNGYGTNSFEITRKDLSEFFETLDIVHKSRKKRVPRFAMEWDRSCLKCLLKGLMKGDGTIDEDGRYRQYHTTSERLANDVQEIAAKLGIPSKICEGVTEGFDDEIKILTVNFHQHNRTSLQKLDVETVEYDGKVYCVEVPNGTLIVRRNGRPMVSGNCQWWAYDPDSDTHVMFREIYKTQELVEDMAEMIKNLSQRMNIEQSFADPAQAEDRQTLKKHGVRTETAKKDISMGIQEVKSKLSHEEDDPSIFFLDGCLAHSPDDSLKDSNSPQSTIGEITQYQWKENKTDEPEKENDHGMDAMRYYIYTQSTNSTYGRDELEKIEETMNTNF